MSAKTLGLSSSGKKRYGGGMLTLEISVKPGRTPPIRRPFEEELLRIVICPNCGLDHVIYGLAFWCPDCGTDIFLTHVKSEYNVVRTILNDVERRRESLGSRIAARDIENCLEDLVTIFEAVLKTITCKFLRINDSNETEIQTILQKQIRNAFQNPDRAKNLIIKYLGVDLFDNMPEESVEKIRSIFEKRHLITHNLGVIDKKYLKQVMAYGEEGKEIRVTKQEVHSTIDLCYTILSTLYNRVFN